MRIRGTAVSLDLLLLWGFSLLYIVWRPPNTPEHFLAISSVGRLVVLAMVGYLLLDLASTVVSERTSSLSRLTSKLPQFVYFGKITVLVFVVASVVVYPTALLVAGRNAGLSSRYVHDAPPAIEQATKYFLEGKNPYTQSYLDTPGVGDFLFDTLDGVSITNPAAYHYAFMPLTFIASAPFYLLFERFLGWYDERFLYIILFAATLLLVPKLATDRTTKLTLVIAVGLNPFLVPYMAYGHNTILHFFPLALALVFLSQGRVGLSAVALGLAAATKQVVWFFAPFYLLYLMGHRPLREGVAHVLRKAYPLFLVAGAIILPFVLWAPGAFYESTWLYLSGNMATSYPVGGVGFSRLLFDFGLLKSSLAVDSPPLGIVQFGLGLPILVLLLLRQRRYNNLRESLIGFAILYFIFTYFNRTYTGESHIAEPIVILLLAFLLDPLTAAKDDGAKTTGPETQVGEASPSPIKARS